MKTKNAQHTPGRVVELTNSFHGTSCRIVVSSDYPEGSEYSELQADAYREQSDWVYGPARRKLARIHRTLCGCDGCTCGTVR